MYPTTPAAQPTPASEVAGTAPAPGASPPPADVTTVLGITRRSGTNYLQDLLCLHPGCRRSAVPEDYLVHASPLLDRYIRSAARQWNPRWGASADGLWANLGAGLVRFLASRCQDDAPAEGPGRPSWLVTKTPSTSGIFNVPKLFPGGRLIIVVRDGRDVVESARRSFDEDFEWICRQWARSAERINRFCRTDARTFPTRVVRYEELFADPCRTMTELCGFLGLDVSDYDFEAARQLPVRGSCAVRQSPADAMHWRPLPRTEAFAPVGRWRAWSPEEQERFFRIARRQMKLLGYL